MARPFARVPSRWLRVALVALVLGFGLNTIAHVGHTHEAASTTAHNVACGYCVHVGHMADGTRHAQPAPPPPTDIGIALTQRAPTLSRLPDRTAQPRAPPHLKR